jgi:Sulfotransferase domain
MYRACSTWQYEVVAHLIERHRDGQRLGYLTSDEYAELVRSEGSGPSVPARRRWRVLKSHDGAPCFARALAAGRACVIYSYRDVRDVVFSMMHKRGLPFEKLLREGTIHQILANDRFWACQPDVMVQRYEDLITDPVGGVVGLAHHLGIALEPGEAERIAGEYSQESNRARTTALRARLQEAGVDLSSPSNAQICDASTLLHWNHMRTAGSSWRELATLQETVLLHRLCGRWLQAHGYALASGAPRAVPARAPVRARLASQGDLVVGRVNFLARAVSLRFPRTARRIKRLLAGSTEPVRGARTWPEAQADAAAAPVVEPSGFEIASPRQTLS